MRRSPVVRRGGRIRRIGPRDGSVPAPCAGGTRRSAGRCVPPPEAPPPRRRRSGGRPARAGRGGAAGARATSAAWVRRDAPPPPPLGPPTARGSGTPSSERTPARSHLEPRSSCVFQGAPPRLQGRPCTVGPNPSPGGGRRKEEQMRRILTGTLIAASLSLVLAPAAVASPPTQIPFEEVFQDVDPCTGAVHTVTIAGTFFVHDHNGRFVASGERTLSTSSGYSGRGTSSFVDNGRVEMFRLTDVLADDAGNRIRARAVFVLDLSRDEVRIDIVVRRHDYLPGAYTGWHSHPGPVFITVTQGTLTYYEYDDPTCTPHVVSVGEGFVDDGRGHIVRNETDQPAQDVSVITAPVGGAFRGELTAPGLYCDF